MEPTSRRQFLKRSSAVAAAAGVGGRGTRHCREGIDRRTRHSESRPTLPDDPSVDVPVVAHVS